VKNILFVCSENKLRSPTAENIFSDKEGFEVRSAGTSNASRNCINEEIIEWADIIVGMEEQHLRKIRQNFRHILHQQKMISLGIPDIYKYMDEELIELLRKRTKDIFRK
jgi:predicted protein tyrosine phosphatase